MFEISNEAGEIVFTGQSEAECARWWFDNGRKGDFLVQTDESIKESLGQS